MKKIKNYINPDKLKINYFENHLNVVNYSQIVLLTSEKIIITKDSETITIKGNDLTLLKLLENEVLIQGIIKNIEF